MSSVNMITPGQIRSLRTGISTIAGKDNAAHLYIVNKLMEKDLKTLSELTRHEWHQLRDQMYPRWHDDDWSLGSVFRKRCANLFAEYREVVLGQRRLL